MILSPNEYKFLSLLWSEGRPLSRAELLNGTEGRNWNPASIHLILNAMISKGAIRITNDGKTYGRTYEPAITYQEYLMEVVKEAVPDKPVAEVFRECAKMLEGWEKVGEKAMKEVNKRRKKQ